MKAVLWPYKYADMRTSWAKQMCWVVLGLLDAGVEVKRHPDFRCQGLEGLPLYDAKTDNPADICIYNHADDSELVGNVLKARYNLFFKPTVPTPTHTTLDSLGYGPFSDISFNRPPFDQVSPAEAEAFYAGTVKGWIEARATKWGQSSAAIPEDLPATGYHLVLGQCGADSVVTRMDFGDYWLRLAQVVREVVRVDPRPVVVKLHPHTDGENAKETRFSDLQAANLRAIDPRVKVYTGKSNLHAFLPGARAVLLANSGAGFEAMMHLKPIIAWGHPEYHWAAYDLRLLCDMRYALSLKWFCPGCVGGFLTWYMTRYAFDTQEGAARRVKQLLEGMKC